MGIWADTATPLLVFTRRLLLLACVSAASLSPVRGQSSIPPLPALPVTFAFSNCDSGVTYQATITDWLRDASGNVDPLSVKKVAQPTSVTYTYTFWGSFSMTAGGTTQVATGGRLPDGSVGRPLGGLTIMYSNLGVATIPPATSFLLQSSNANGLGVGTGAGTANLAWTASLYGAGDLMPNGILSPLPPIAAWTPVNTFINGDGKLLARPITQYGACGASPPPPAGKALGDPNTPGNCGCGEPISIGNGNLFEQVTDYQTFGPNKLAFIRYYNSLGATNTFANTLGVKWRSNYDRYLRIVSASSVIAERPDGRQLNFTLTSGAWTTDSDVDLKLSNSGTTWTLTDIDDSVETYSVAAGSSQALLQSIRARNGYTQTLQYGSGTQLAIVTDSFRRQLTFVYSGGKLQTVNTPDGLILTYSYTGTQLTSVGYSPSPPTKQTYLYENTALPSALTGIIDENGNRFATWTYDSTGRALSSQHAGGADLTTISYNASDGSRTIANALGEREVWKFTTLQGVPKMTEVDRLASASLPAAVRKFTYDSNGYLASQTDWNGNLTSYVNDARGRATTINEAVGTPQARTTTISYHATFHLPLRIVTPGLTTSFTYDASGQMLTQTLTDTTTTTVPYSTAGQTRTWTYTWSNFLRTSVQTPRTDVKGLTAFTYDSSGALTGITNAQGHMTRVTQHLPGGWPQTVVDANGVTINLAYDARQRLLSSTMMTAAGPLTASYRYDAAGNRLGASLPDGSALINTYDTAHRLTGITDLLNQHIALTLDALGNPTQISVTNASGDVQRKRSANFDALGRLLQDIGGVGQISGLTYDANGNAISIADPLGRVTNQTFDALNRRVAVTDAAKGVTSTGFDAHDRPVRVTDANASATTYVYDGFGDVIQRVSPDSGTTIYRYDADGNMTQRVDGAGAVSNLTYDALDRPMAVTYPTHTSENVAYAYDQGIFGKGRLTGVSDAAGTMTRSYDERGNVLSETRVIGPASLLTLYTYDAANRIASITYPSGWTAIYKRDAMGRVTEVSVQAPDGSAAIPVVGGVSYQPFGPVNALTYGNGVAETSSFDLDYRLTNLSGGGIQDLAYAYDAANNVSSIADGVNAGASQNFTYDPLDRLTGATGSYGAIVYTYDSVGNRLTQSVGGSTLAYVYSAKSNQLASIGADGAMQTLNHSKAGNIDNLGSSDLLYNQAGRLAAFMAQSNFVAQYTYDAFGNRLGRVGAVTATTLYQYDVNRRLLEETDGQGNALVDYIYLGNRPVATISPGDGQVYFLHNDRLGTPQVATDGNQNVVWSASYGPFGELSTVPALIVQNLRLPGQEFDVESGLYHNGFRDYAPALGRYLQSDPIGLRGGVNTYAYVGANPINLIDRLGLSWWSDVKDDYQAFSSWVGDKWNEVKSSPCVVKARQEAQELYNEAIQELKKLEPAADTIELLKDLWDTAEGDVTGALGILQRLYQQRANDPTKSWGTRCVPADCPWLPPDPPPPVPPAPPQHP